MSKHSRLSASASYRWWNCPGSVAATEKFPSKATRYTAEGTVAHGIAADTLSKKWDYDKLETLVGLEKAEDEFIISITEEMIDAVWEYAVFVRSHMQRGAIMYVEKRIELPEIHEELFATPDCRIIWPYEKIFVFDFKYGAGKKVSAYENTQLLYYALRDFLDEDILEIEVSIVQPRIGTDHISSYCVDHVYMGQFVLDLRKKAEAALKSKAPLVAGDWCQKSFCPVFKTCAAAREKAQALVAQDFDDVPTVDKLTLKQIVRILDNQDFIKSWLTQVSDYAKELIRQGERIPGYKLIKSFGHRKWASEDAVLADFEGKYGDKMYAPKKLKSPAQLEKIIGKKEVEPYVFKPETGIKLVKEETPGEPATMITAADDFNE